MPTVKFVNEKKTIEVDEGANLRKEALKAGIDLYQGPFKLLNCHGFGHCASCKVVIKKGKENVSEPGAWEKLRLWAGPISFISKLSHEDEDIRLSCRIQVHGDIEVETQPEINWHGDQFWG